MKPTLPDLEVKLRAHGVAAVRVAFSAGLWWAFSRYAVGVADTMEDAILSMLHTIESKKVKQLERQN